MLIETKILIDGSTVGLSIPVSSKEIKGLQISNARIMSDKRSVPIRQFPEGQIEWTQQGSYNWIVPEGVFELSAITMGAGGRNGSSPSSIDTGGGGGGGGGTAYGTFAVSPGEQLQIHVSGSSNLYSQIRKQNLVYVLQAARGSDGGDGGRTGSASGGAGGAAYIRNAVGSALRGSAGGRGSYNRRPITGSPGYAPEIQGLGRGRTRLSQSIDSFGTVSRGGSVRIIWGRGRNYPNTNIENV